MKRVLFVDDEPMILRGLERSLRSRRDDWDMTFVDSAAAALAVVETEPPDVLVTDMRMPGMDGVALLKEVARRSPGTVRIILSGHADVSEVVRSVCVSHRYLAKPCKSADLQEVVERVCALDGVLGDPSLRSVVAGVTTLPVGASLRAAMARALNDPDVDPDRIGGLVERDPGLAARILQVANSSYFGVGREVTDIRSAIATLSPATLRRLSSDPSLFEAAVRPAAERASRWEERAVLVARIARRLAPTHGSEAYLAGLFHGIGELVLAHYDRHLVVEGEGAAPATAAIPVGRSAPVGAYLLGLWGIPTAVVQAVAHFDRPSHFAEPVAGAVLAAVHAATRLVGELTERATSRLEWDRAFFAERWLSGGRVGWVALAREEVVRMRRVRFSASGGGG